MMRGAPAISKEALSTVNKCRHVRDSDAALKAFDQIWASQEGDEDYRHPNQHLSCKKWSLWAFGRYLSTMTEHLNLHWATSGFFSHRAACSNTHFCVLTSLCTCPPLESTKTSTEVDELNGINDNQTSTPNAPTVNKGEKHRTLSGEYNVGFIQPDRHFGRQAVKQLN